MIGGNPEFLIPSGVIVVGTAEVLWIDAFPALVPSCLSVSFLKATSAIRRITSGIRWRIGLGIVGRFGDRLGAAFHELFHLGNGVHGPGFHSG